MPIKIMTRRELATVFLIGRYVREEEGRVQAIRADNTTRCLLMGKPSFSYLWRSKVEGALNDFIRSHDNFDVILASANQAGRLVTFLRSSGLVYNPDDPRDFRDMGDDTTLVPKPELWTLYSELVRRFGENPTDWPDELPFDLDRKIALWDQATFSGKPVLITQ